MNLLDNIKKEIIEAINQALKQKLVKVSDLVYPPAFAKASAGKPDKKMGDISLPCFNISKEPGKSPAKIAQNLVSDLGSTISAVSSTNAVGPYLNFKIKTNILAKELITEINKKPIEYGKNKSGKKKKVMLEYSNANTHKEYHVGHLRNISYGDAVNRILAANGFKTIPVSYINDFGIHVAKTLWALNEYFKDQEPGDNKGEFLAQVYVKGAQESKDNQVNKRMIEGMMKKIETGKGEEYKQWQETREWSIVQFDQIYKELDIEFEHIFYESEYIEAGKKLIPKLVDKGILKESQGAIIADLEEYDLGVLVVLRSDHTATYPVADIPLARAKQKKYQADTSVYVVDVAQTLYFKQLFKILELMGHKEELEHLAYEFVKLPGGAMSSRTGNIVSYEELKQKLMDKTVAETKERHSDWSEEKIKATAKTLALSAMKFEMIKVGANQIITFDIKKALEFSGYTAAYLLYSVARINSIFKKAHNTQHVAHNINFEKLTEKSEHRLLLQVAKYPEIVKRAGKSHDPSGIARYLFELAQEFNDYYHSVSVLKAEKDIRDARLALLQAIQTVFKNGLGLLGIVTLEEM
ncbi:arginine--tRNA ligase [Candidatus Parcubacteria bacterium]|nr:arginine--tRNA ligase [Candidatus Parcubacteria bacterium]